MNKEQSLALTTGLALFSMFFGSGNLVFPLIVGTQSGDNSLWAIIGLILTAVCMPLLGCIGILMYDGEPNKFFKVLGHKGFLIFSFICLALMGPFGVLARCLTVAHGTFTHFYPSFTLWEFSLISCGLLFGAALWRSKIIELIGAWLTPILLLALGAIFMFSMFDEGSLMLSSTSSWDAFSLGSSKGYQMMDLIASLFFSGFIIAQLRKDAIDSKMLHRVFLKSSVIAGLLLAIMYTCLVSLGFQYASILKDVPPESMLASIALHTMGSWSGAVVCVAFALACYTTALVLTVLFADFLRKEICKDVIPEWLALIVTLGIAFFVSTLEFSGIARFLGPILDTSYPLLIVLTVWNIARAWMKGRKSPDLMCTEG